MLVIDANLGLALALPLPYSYHMLRRMESWGAGREQILIPSLWEYEVVSGLRRACAVGLVSENAAIQALDALLELGFLVIQAGPDTHRRALGLAGRLGQARAYDAQYLALAEISGCEFWTADQRLVQRCQQLGLAWVHWIGEE